MMSVEALYVVVFQHALFFPLSLLSHTQKITCINLVIVGGGL